MLISILFDDLQFCGSSRRNCIYLIVYVFQNYVNTLNTYLLLPMTEVFSKVNVNTSDYYHQSSVQGLS